MSETILEALRRQMRVSERRIESASDEGVQKSSAIEPHPPKDNPESSAKLHEIGDPLGEWAAYGQMTPGFLSEVSAFIAENIQSAMQTVPAHAKSEMTEVIQMADRIQSLLSRWIESSECLSPSIATCRYPELLQVALSVRRAELVRWGIQIEIEDGTVGMEAYGCTLSLFQAILHVTQYCIEQLPTTHGASHLLIRLQNSGGRLETIFAWNTDHREKQAGAADTGWAPYGRNVELQAAQKCLNRLGGTLVLENIGETQRAVRMTVSLAALPAAENLRQVPRS